MGRVNPNEGDPISIRRAIQELDKLTKTASDHHAHRHTDGSDDIQNATASQKGLATEAQITKLEGIETGADVTDAANVDAAGAVMNSDYDANTILVANTDNTPAALTVAEQRIVGRITGGNIGALTLTQIIDMVGSAAEGDILYRGASAWSRLAKGTDGYVLKMGASAPSWIKLGQGFLAYASSAQTLTTETYTKININTESFDSEGWYDKDTNYRFTPLVSGLYLVGTSVIINTLADTKYAFPLIYKNGTPIARGCNWMLGGAGHAQPQGVYLVSMNGSTDYVEMYAWHNNGSNRDTIGGDPQYTFFWAVRVG